MIYRRSAHARVCVQEQKIKIRTKRSKNKITKIQITETRALFWQKHNATCYFFARATRIFCSPLLVCKLPDGLQTTMIEMRKYTRRKLPIAPPYYAKQKRRRSNYVCLQQTKKCASVCARLRNQNHNEPRSWTFFTAFALAICARGGRAALRSTANGKR